MGVLRFGPCDSACVSTLQDSAVDDLPMSALVPSAPRPQPKLSMHELAAVGSALLANAAMPATSPEAARAVASILGILAPRIRNSGLAIRCPAIRCPAIRCPAI
eukprot:313149-Alexandrium_andersonii.AAC.1